MSERKYEVLDEIGYTYASNMSLSTALTLIEALCKKYFNDREAKYTLKEMDKIKNEGDL